VAESAARLQLSGIDHCLGGIFKMLVIVQFYVDRMISDAERFSKIVIRHLSRKPNESKEAIATSLVKSLMMSTDIS
jgi:cytochrome c biogenesis protein ResB